MTTLNHKYRPRKLEDFIGQQSTIAVLRGMLSGEGDHPQAFLMEGPYGSGKTSLGRVISARLNCLDPQGHNPCWKCDSCKKMAADPAPNHPCHREINASDKRKIDDVRSWIQQSQYSAPGGNYRVFMLDEPHMLTPQAQEALLKPLEDPNSGTIWILCTTDASKLKPALRSRLESGRMPIREVPTQELAKRVSQIAKKEGQKLSKEVCISIASGVNNHPRDAIGVLERVLAAKGKFSKKDVDEMVDDVIEETVKGSPDKVAQQICYGLLAGELAYSIKEVQSTSLPADVLLQAVARVWYNIITWYTAAEAVDPYYARCFRFERDMPRNMNEDEVAILIEAGEKLAKGYERARTYLQDEKFLRLHTISSMWEVCRDLNENDEE